MTARIGDTPNFEDYEAQALEAIREIRPEVKSWTFHQPTTEELDIRLILEQQVRSYPDHVKFDHVVTGHGAGSIIDGDWILVTRDGDVISWQRYVDENFAPGERVLINSCSVERLTQNNTTNFQYVILESGATYPVDAGEGFIRTGVIDRIADQAGTNLAQLRQLDPDTFKQIFETEIDPRRVPDNSSQGRIRRAFERHDTTGGSHRFAVDHDDATPLHTRQRGGGIYPGRDAEQYLNAYPREYRERVIRLSDIFSTQVPGWTDNALVNDLNLTSRLELGLPAPTASFTGSRADLAQDLYRQVPTPIQQRADLIAEFRGEPLDVSHIVQANRAASNPDSLYTGSRYVLSGFDRDTINAITPRDLGIRFYPSEELAEQAALATPKINQYTFGGLDSPYVYQSFSPPNEFRNEIAKVGRILDEAYTALEDSLPRAIPRLDSAQIRNYDDLVDFVASEAMRQGRNPEEVLNVFNRRMRENLADSGYTSAIGRNDTILTFGDTDLVAVRRLPDVELPQADASASNVAASLGRSGEAAQKRKGLIQQLKERIKNQIEDNDSRIQYQLDNLDRKQRQLADEVAQEQRVLRESNRIEAERLNTQTDLSLVNDYDPVIGTQPPWC
jgi:hypothetical protein